MHIDGGCCFYDFQMLHWSNKSSLMVLKFVKVACPRVIISRNGESCGSSELVCVEGKILP